MTVKMSEVKLSKDTLLFFFILKGKPLNGINK